MKQFDLKRVMAILGQMLRCPVCSFEYNLGKTRVVESEQDEAGEARMVIHSECARCQSSVMFNVDIIGKEIISAAMVTDLTASDTKRFTAKDPIAADEVIDLHKSLNKTKTVNFKKLLSV